VATDRCLLGSHQDRLVLKENKIRKTDLSECNERDQPISVQTQRNRDRRLHVLHKSE